MRIPIGETEIGVIYELIDNKSAFFYTLDSAYYVNCMSKNNEEYIICTFSEFKKSYPRLIYSNYRSK